jgi:hypothetical protein
LRRASFFLQQQAPLPTTTLTIAVVVAPALVVATLEEAQQMGVLANSLESLPVLEEAAELSACQAVHHMVVHSATLGYLTELDPRQALILLQ